MAASYKVQSIAQLTKHIRTVSKETAKVFLSEHARKRMRQRNVLDAEVFHCLRSGKINMQPEEDLKTGNLVCRMEGYGASKNLAVCAALDDADPNIIVVTVIVV